MKQLLFALTLFLLVGCDATPDNKLLCSQNGEAYILVREPAKLAPQGLVTKAEKLDNLCQKG